MDKLSKFLNKLSLKEKKSVLEVLVRIRNNQLSGLDVKKLKGRDDVYRVRKGTIRIIYCLDSGGLIKILDVGRRNDTIYS